MLVEGLRQGRDHHLGGAADRLPVGRPRPAGVRTPRLPARGGVQLVHVLADAGALPVRARGAAGAVPGGEGPHGRRPGGGVGEHRRRPRDRPAVQGGPRQGRPGPGDVGRGGRDGRRRAGAHDPPLRPGPDRGLLAHPGDVDGVPRGRCPVPRAARGADAVVLRLVRRPAGRVAAGVRRPDGRAGVRRLVGRRLPHHVGLEPARDPHAGRALDGGGAVPGPEGRGGVARLRGQREVRRRVARGRPGDGRRPGDGDGARGAPGVLRRAAGAVLPGLRAPLHRPAVPRAAGPHRGGLRPRQVPHRGGPAGCRGAQRERGVQDRAGRRGHGRPGGPGRVARVPLRRAGRGAVEPRPRRHRPAAVRRGRPRGAGARHGAAPAVRRRRRHAGHGAARGAGAAGGRPPGDVGVRPGARPVRRRPARAAGRVAHRVRRPDAGLHARVAGAVHRRPRREGGAHRPRVRRERRGVARPVHDRHGCRDQPLVPLRHDLPRVPRADHADRLPGRERRRLGALRRPGEGAARDRARALRERPRLGPPRPHHDPDRLLVPAQRPVPVRPVRRGQPVLGRAGGGRRAARGPQHGGRHRAVRAARLDAVVPDVRPEPARPRRRRRGVGPAGGGARAGAADVRGAAVRRGGRGRGR